MRLHESVRDVAVELGGSNVTRPRLTPALARSAVRKLGALADFIPEVTLSSDPSVSPYSVVTRCELKPIGADDNEIFSVGLGAGCVARERCEGQQDALQRASDLALIDALLRAGFEEYFSAVDSLPPDVKLGAYSLPDAGGSIPVVEAPSGPIPVFVPESATSVAKGPQEVARYFPGEDTFLGSSKPKVDPVAAAEVAGTPVPFTGDPREDVILAAKALTQLFPGKTWSDVLAELSAFIGNDGSKVPGFRNPSSVSEKRLRVTLDRLKKKLADAKLISNTDEVGF